MNVYVPVATFADAPGNDESSVNRYATGWLITPTPWPGASDPVTTPVLPAATPDRPDSENRPLVVPVPPRATRKPAALPAEPVAVTGAV